MLVQTIFLRVPNTANVSTHVKQLIAIWVRFPASQQVNLNNMEKKKLTIGYLERLKPGYTNKGFNVPKWIKFSEEMIKLGWECEYYDSYSTVSKYIYIAKNNYHFKIRFSNHKLNKYQQDISDSDFYVGISHNQVLTTEQLIEKLKSLTPS